ncbi:YgjV family protein [Leifsonia sp. Leaf264]|uniref:YgjV family protein n=1 Tax=Leifsonia sp. Leaf264 TaxID=1736314 RepID=UPI0006FD8003|nr:YgjV family protein [Leifsonia sp. Leaf264]KQO98180.1 hypothetical protein ASF30_08965 [Leifsonia sp. Leaf264]
MVEIGSAAWLTSQIFAAIGYPIRLWSHWQTTRTRTLAGSAIGAAFQTLGLICLGMYGAAAAGSLSVIRNLIHLGSDKTTRREQVGLGVTFAVLAVIAYMAFEIKIDSIAWWFPVGSVVVTAIGQAFPSRFVVKLSAFIGTGLWAATYASVGAWVAFAGDTIGATLALIALSRICVDWYRKAHGLPIPDRTKKPKPVKAA